MKILDGRIVAESIYKKLIPRIEKLNKSGIHPALAAIIVGDDEPSRIYVAAKSRRAEKLGIDFLKYQLLSDSTPSDLKCLLQTLNSDPSVHGILVQLPLPKGYNRDLVANQISPLKDIDGFGWIESGRGRFLPPTPAGIIELLHYYRYPIKNKSVVIIGSGFLVGRPLARMMERLGGKVTVCDSKSICLKDTISQANILVSATGVAGIVTGQMVKKGAVVVDAGNIRDPKASQVVGDVDFRSVKKVAGAITPVPGGVGPVTVAKLLENVVLAAEKRTK